MKQNRFKQRLAMLMMAGMTVSQLNMPIFAVEADAVDVDGVKVGYYGQQLLDESKQATTTAAQIYVNINKAWKDSGTGKALIYEVTMDTDRDLSEASSAQIQEYLVEHGLDIKLIYNQVIQAIMYDYPEFYWLSGEISCGLGYSVAGNKLKVSVEIDKQEEGVINTKQAIDQAVDQAITQINQTNPKTDYEKVVAINNYLVESFDYNQDASKSDDEKYRDAHTLVGAFIGSGDVAKGNVVCEGYAKAFKAICDKMNIRSILVSGTGITSTGSENHMWNYVEMEGNWYLVDVTWDDPILDGGAQNDNPTKYVLVGGDEEHRHNNGQLSSTSNLNGCFTYPDVNDTAYKVTDENTDTNADLTFLDYCIKGEEPVKVKDFMSNKLDYTVILPNGTASDAKISLGGKVAAEGAICTPTPKVCELKNGMGKAEIKVTAPDGKTSNTYSIQFFTEESMNADLTFLDYCIEGEEYVKVKDFVSNKLDYEVVLPEGTAEDAIIHVGGNMAAGGATFTRIPEALKLENGMGKAEVKVTAADGVHSNTYSITFTIAKSNDASLSSVLYWVGGKQYDIMVQPGQKEIDIEVPYTTPKNAQIDIRALPTNSKAKVECKPIVLKDGTGTGIVNIVATDGKTTANYKINVKVASSITINQPLSNIKVYKGKDATFEIKYTPAVSGDYTIVWNSATQKDVVSKLTLEANKTTSSILTIKKATTADKGEVSVRISRDADLTDYIESKANLGLKSSSSDSSTGSKNNTSGGGSGSSTTSADKKVSEAWKELSTAKQEEVKEKFKNNMPYVLPADGLTEDLLKDLLGSDFTEAQIKEIIAEPNKLKDLGINYTADTVVLTPVEEVNFKDMNNSHWAYSNIEKLAKLGVVKGFEDNTFRPKETLAVADTFTFLNRVMLLNNDTYMNLSRETVEKYVTNKESWAFKDVATIGSKLSEKTLKEISALGDGPLSRGLLAQVLFEATQGKLQQATEGVNFVDTQNSPYQEAIDYCVKVGLLKGTSVDKMQPEKALTRAELMTVLVRLNDLMK